jgi:hypothetical protein
MLTTAIGILKHHMPQNEQQKRRGQKILTSSASPFIIGGQYIT